MSNKTLTLAATLIALVLVVPVIHAGDKTSCVTISAESIALIPDIFVYPEEPCQITKYQREFPDEVFLGTLPDKYGKTDPEAFCFTLAPEASGKIIIDEKPALDIELRAVSGLTSNTYLPLPSPYGSEDPKVPPPVLPFTSAAKIDVIYDGEKLMTLWTRDSGTLFFNTEVSPFIPWGTETLVITGSESHFYSDDYDDDDYDTGIRGRFELLGPVVFSPAVETTLSGRLCGKKLKKRILKLADHDYRRYDDDGDDDDDDDDYGDDD